MLRVCLGVVLAAALIAGCSRKAELIPVTGTVKIDGQLAEGVQVHFWPADGNDSRNRYASGMTSKDGRFELRSIAEAGIEPGEYKVTFSRLMVGNKVIADPRMRSDKARESLPARYTDQNATPTTARVTRDSNDFVFDLSSSPN